MTRAIDRLRGRRAQAEPASGRAIVRKVGDEAEGTAAAAAAAEASFTLQPGGAEGGTTGPREVRRGWLE